jgi:hypothetical protein
VFYTIAGMTKEPPKKMKESLKALKRAACEMSISVPSVLFSVSVVPCFGISKNRSTQPTIHVIKQVSTMRKGVK